MCSREIIRSHIGSDGRFTGGTIPASDMGKPGEEATDR
jgi:hypothetical protein